MLQYRTLIAYDIVITLFNLWHPNNTIHLPKVEVFNLVRSVYRKKVVYKLYNNTRYINENIIVLAMI